MLVRKCLLIVSFCMFVLCSCESQPKNSQILNAKTGSNVWTVDDSGGADFYDIQSAVKAASDGDEILVYPGTYTDIGDNVVDMMGKAVWLHSSDGSETTIIDGQGVRRGVFCHNAETAKTFIEGFTIQNCDAPWFDFNQDGEVTRREFAGAGMANLSSNPTVTNCIFRWNNSMTGCGIYNRASSPTITDCQFIENYTVREGAGVYCLLSSEAILSNCTFASNSAYRGGGILSTQDSHTTLQDCSFLNNVARSEQAGGGMICNGTLINCTFIGNTSGTKGGALWTQDVTLTNCVIKDNLAGRSGGGIYVHSNTTLTGTTVCGNTPDQIYGSWTDGGGNTVADTCPK